MTVYIARMTTDDQSIRDKRRVYGRRKTRSLSAAKEDIFETDLHRLQIPSDSLARGKLTVIDIFDKDYKNFWFEIGFGNGEHLKNEALANPDTAFVGAEPFINGMAAFLQSISGQDDKNIRVYMDDAMTVVDALADPTSAMTERAVELAKRVNAMALGG